MLSCAYLASASVLVESICDLVACDCGSLVTESIFSSATFVDVVAAV